MKAHCRVGRHQGTVFSMLYHTLRCGQHNRQLVNLSLLCTCLPSSILAMHICHIMLTLEKPTVISLMSIVFMSVTHLDCTSFMFLSRLKHGTSASSAASALIFGLHHFKVSSKMDPEAIRKVMFSQYRLCGLGQRTLQFTTHRPSSVECFYLCLYVHVYRDAWMPWRSMWPTAAVTTQKQTDEEGDEDRSWRPHRLPPGQMKSTPADPKYFRSGDHQITIKSS